MDNVYDAYDVDAGTERACGYDLIARTIDNITTPIIG